MLKCEIRGSITRRHAITGLLSTVAATALAAPMSALAQELAEVPEKTPFNFDLLTEQMRAAALQPPKPADAIEGFLTKLSYDDYQRVRFDRKRTRWADAENMPFHLNAFHPGWLFNEPVLLNEVVDGIATPMGFSTADFDYSDVKAEIPANFEMPGVAGFRLMAPLNRADHYDELVAFLGASYFRALGRDNRYGLSARGLAVNTGMPNGEEFPRFTDFWLERPTQNSDRVVLYAALKSTSVTGAYKFVIKPSQTTVMEVTARLFMRKNVQQLGIAPLTSMFLFGGADPGDFNDFRPAVHDSDHLVLNTQNGDTFVRPLTNPGQLGHSYLTAQNPMSFGLIQRQRDFDQYLDAQAHYERRPSLMVEPIGEWGQGSVRLMEIPSDLEGNDNIVAYWVPETPPAKGESLEVSYRLHWGMSPSGDRSSDRAQIVRTRIGDGGVAGVQKETDRIKFVVDFKGGALSKLPDDADVVPQVTVLRGKLAQAIFSRVDGTDLWRLVIEAVPDNSETSMELQAAINGYGHILTETWLYQWKAL
ncbi:glucan biosynthesis protein [Pacificibacter marinus]|uniref:Glucans biosynthesis protein G n=1 Tax=Pacificibacter marinus TaxID=658057 RepID=A0A1Y5RJB2_9RHOB|nr:glucan biosynthesis protein G [Pacificibacter marinus]SEK18253.1 glucans biosynthesis protein [Pacificibacter marinus]SLN18909.1 Glucans biosynthesis protein G precursor [Pacificibacter marinus]